MSKIQPGSGYGFTSGGYGFSLNTENPFPVDNSVNPPLRPNLSGDTAVVNVGTVNRYIPKIGSTYIDADPAPTLAITGAGYICVKATYEANKFFPRTATIVFESGATPPADTNTDSYYPLARVNQTTTGGVTTNTLTLLAEMGNLSVNRLKAGANTATWWWTRV